MGVGAGLFMYDVVVKSSRSLSHLLMSIEFLSLGLSDRGSSDTKYDRDGSNVCVCERCRPIRRTAFVRLVDDLLTTSCTTKSTTNPHAIEPVEFGL